MYNCGIVGQLAYCLIPSRISLSAKTSTAANCAAQDCNSCTDLAEKPHCGACGRPFIKSTMSFCVICCLILSRTFIFLPLPLSKLKETLKKSCLTFFRDEKRKVR